MLSDAEREKNNVSDTFELLDCKVPDRRLTRRADA